MFLCIHATVGAIVGEATGNPILAAIGGFVSHFLFDIIPHGDLEKYRRFKRREGVKEALAATAVDSMVTIFFILFLFNFRDFIHPLNVTLGISFGILPDLLVGLYETGKFSWLKKFHTLHFFFHNYYINKRSDVSMRFGFFMQILVLAILQLRAF